MEKEITCLEFSEIETDIRELSDTVSSLKSFLLVGSVDFSWGNKVPRKWLSDVESVHIIQTAFREIQQDM